jgi:hypothetical protein
LTIIIWKLDKWNYSIDDYYSKLDKWNYGIDVYYMDIYEFNAINLNDIKSTLENCPGKAYKDML